MTGSEKTVFISYRRDASSVLVRMIFHDLRANGFDVFMDLPESSYDLSADLPDKTLDENKDHLPEKPVDTTDAEVRIGELDPIIAHQIAARAHFLLICNPNTFKHCSRPGSRLRLEIKTAIDQQRNIVPVLANDFDFGGSRDHLAGGLLTLPHRNALPLYSEYFDEGMARLRDQYLLVPAAGAPVSPPPGDLAEVDAKLNTIAAMPVPNRDDLTAEKLVYRSLTRWRRDMHAAFVDCSEAIQLSPSYALAYEFRGFACIELDELERGIADCKEAIRINPGNAWPYIHRGVAHFRRNELAEAIADYDQAIRLDPNISRAYFRRANARLDLADPEGALHDYDRAILLDSTSAEALYFRGTAHFSLQHFEEARLDFERTLEIERSHESWGSEALAGLAISLRALDRTDEALARWHDLIWPEKYRDPDLVRKKFSFCPAMAEAFLKFSADFGDSLIS